jgi:hypothetical protein
MAQPEGDPAAKAAQNHQPEPEDPHRGASRRRIIGDTERPSTGQPEARTVGTAERMQGRETGPRHRRQSRTGTATRGNSHALYGRPAGSRQAAGQLAAGRPQAVPGIPASGQPGGLSHRHSLWTGADGATRKSRRRHGRAQQRGATRSSSAKPSRKVQSAGATRAECTVKAERIDG